MCQNDTTLIVYTCCVTLHRFHGRNKCFKKRQLPKHSSIYPHRGENSLCSIWRLWKIKLYFRTLLCFEWRNFGTHICLKYPKLFLKMQPIFSNWQMISSQYPPHPLPLFLSFPKILLCLAQKDQTSFFFEFHLHEQNECVLIILVVWTRFQAVTVLLQRTHQSVLKVTRGALIPVAFQYGVSEQQPGPSRVQA